MLEVKYNKLQAELKAIKSRATRDRLSKTICKALDSKGSELRTWKENYFGYHLEEELVNDLAQALEEMINGKSI